MLLSEFVEEGDAPIVKLAVTESDCDGELDGELEVLRDGLVDIEFVTEDEELGVVVGDGVRLPDADGNDCKRIENSPSPTSYPNTARVRMVSLL